MTTYLHPEVPQEPTTAYRIKVRLIVLLARWISAWLDSPRIADAIKDAAITGEDDARMFPRLRKWLRGLREDRIVITRQSQLDAIQLCATTRALRHAAEMPFNVTELSYDLTEGHASRITETGKVLVSV